MNYSYAIEQVEKEVREGPFSAHFQQEIVLVLELARWALPVITLIDKVPAISDRAQEEKP